MINILDRLVLLLSPVARVRRSAGWSLHEGTWYAPFHHDGKPIPERDWLLEGDPLPEHPEYGGLHRSHISLRGPGQ